MIRPGRFPFALTISAALLAGVLVPSLTAQVPSPSHPFEKAEIRRVLVLARDIVLELEKDKDLGCCEQSKRIESLMEDFRELDDWTDALPLIDQAVESHEANVLYPPPHATWSDYERLNQRANQLGYYERDTVLLRLVEQELADGFVPGAELFAASIHIPITRSQALTSVAVVRFERGEREQAAELFKRAEAATAEMKWPYDERQRDDVGIVCELSEIAEQRYTAGDHEGALDLFTRSKTMAASMGRLSSEAFFRVAETELRLGLLADARDTAAKIDMDQYRNMLDFRHAEVVHLPVIEAKRAALALPNGPARISILIAIAQRQKKRQDAITTLDLAFKLLQSKENNPATNPKMADSFRLLSYEYSDRGLRQKALALMQALSNAESQVPNGEREHVKWDLALGYAALGKFDRARKYSAAFHDEQASEAVASMLVEAGRLDEAVALADSYHDLETRANILLRIVQAMQQHNRRPLGRS